jgi:hypothetical protein
MLFNKKWDNLSPPAPPLGVKIGVRNRLEAMRPANTQQRYRNRSGINRDIGKRIFEAKQKRESLI